MRYTPLAFLIPLLSAVVSFAQNPAPKVLFDSIPKTHQLFVRGEGIRIRGTVVSPTVSSISFHVNKDKAIFFSTEFDASGTEKTFNITVPLDQGLF